MRREGKEYVIRRAGVRIGELVARYRRSTCVRWGSVCVRMCVCVCGDVCVVVWEDVCVV